MTDESERSTTDSATDPVSNEVARNVLDNLLEGCQVIDREFRYAYVNPSVAGHGRTTRKALLGRKMSELYPGIERTEMFAVLRGVMTSRHPSQMENEFEFPDGSKGWFELRFEPVPEGVVILSMDVSERKRKELELEHALQALRTLSGCNRALVGATNERTFMQKVCDLLVDDGGYVEAKIHIEQPEHMEVRSKDFGECSYDGAEVSKFDFELGNAPIGTLSIIRSQHHALGALERDLLNEIALELAHGIATIRDRKKHDRLAKELAAARRLTSVERLASGVAHDFNNFLGVVLAYASAALEALNSNEYEHVRGDIERVVEAGQRASTLTRQLLAVGRQQDMEPSLIEPAQFLHNIETMVGGLLPANVELALSVDSSVEKVRVDPDLLERALMNLVINARDAMPNGGRLIIDVANAERGGDPRWVRFSVRDTGMGMAEDVRDQVFEPFFTTKPGSRGTGLGLATVHGIVSQSGGTIDVKSTPGEGSTFDVFLPSAS